MATMQNSIAYAWTTNTDTVSDATAYTFPDLSVTVAENSSGRTFRSATIEVSWDDLITATGGTITEWRVECQIDSVAYSTVTETNDIAHSSENTSYLVGPIDFTSYFQTNFTGNTHTVRCRVYIDISTGTTLQVTNVTAILRLTYDFDDASSTRMNTVYIPLDTTTSKLTTTLTEIGTDQIPNLSTFCPEASKTFYDIFFIIEGNEGVNTTTDYTLALALDSESEVSSGNREMALQSSRFTRFVWKRTDMSTTATHKFKARTVGGAAMSTPAILLVVTYSYSESSTTTKLCSLWYPFEIPSPLGRTTSSDKSRYKRTIMLPVSDVELRQSGVIFSFNSAATVTNVHIAVGSQSYRAYTANVGGVTCGGYALSHRIDSGGAAGSGISLSSGENTFTFDAYTSDSSNMPTNISAVLILNFVCSKPSGVKTAALPKTTFHFMRRTTSQITRHLITGYAPSIPESDYRLMSLGYMFYLIQANATNAIVFTAEVQSSEAEGAGWRDLYADAILTDAEIGSSVVWAKAMDAFKRYPGDADSSRLGLSTTRDYIFYTVHFSLVGIFTICTYHALTWTFSGSLESYSGDGSGVEVCLFNADTHELLKKTTTTTGGAYSFTWHDPYTNLYVSARQSSTKLGRSDNAVAS